MTSSTPTFIVNSGRCGSTMLSNMLHLHPDVLSLSEFFTAAGDIGGRATRIFDSSPISGRQFWDLIGGMPPRLNLMLRHQVEMGEVLYRPDAVHARFTRQSGVPSILQITLPFLSDTPDELFGELEPVMVSLPNAPLADHYKSLFGWLQQRFGRKMWVERSGGIFVVIEPICHAFPDARFVHLVRDGRDTALSMSQHLGFRIYLLGAQIAQFIGVDPYASPDRSRLAELPAELHGFLPEKFQPEIFRNLPISPVLCGQLWSQMIVEGLAVLGKLPAERVLTLRYEDFLSAPDAQLTRLAEFLGEGINNPEWRRKAAATVRQPASSWRHLSIDAAQALADACEPGMAVLREQGVQWD